MRSYATRVIIGQLTVIVEMRDLIRLNGYICAKCAANPSGIDVSTEKHEFQVQRKNVHFARPFNFTKTNYGTSIYLGKYVRQIFKISKDNIFSYNIQFFSYIMNAKSTGK